MVRSVITNQLGQPGANPTIESYNASSVKNYNATSSPARFEANFFSKNTQAYYDAGVVVVNLEVVCRIGS
jgi:hypothetical protein